MVVSIAAAWVILFQLNTWLFSAFENTRFISWLFLPAGLRFLAVLAFGGVGVAGLFLGGLLTAALVSDGSLERAIILAAMSSLCYLGGMFLARRLSGNTAKWHQLDPLQVYVFASLCAACNALLHCAYFAHSGMVDEFLDNLIPMFIGDLAGVFILLYAVAKPLRQLSHRAGETRLPV